MQMALALLLLLLLLKHCNWLLSKHERFVTPVKSKLMRTVMSDVVKRRGADVALPAFCGKIVKLENVAPHCAASICCHALASARFPPNGHPECP